MVAQAEILQREVIAVGNGGDPAAATVDALENAIAQVGGMKLSTATTLTMAEISQGETTIHQEEFRQNIERITRGIVKAYVILESGVSPASQRCFVRIKATIPIYKQSEQLKRLRLAVLPLAIDQNAARHPEGAVFAEGVSASLEAFLTQTRKFAMIDRRSLDATNRELQRARSRDAPIEELARVGARVVADYVVLATLKVLRVENVVDRRPTGREVFRERAEVSIDLRVIDIATGQIKFAQNYVNPGRLPRGMTLTQYASDVGTDLGQAISTAIYPIAVVSAANGHVTLNQGGATVQVGRVYRVVGLGREARDPYTKESLGQEEHEIARIEVVAVTDRTAEARVVVGQVPASARPGDFLARVLPDEGVSILAAEASLQGPLTTGSGVRDPQGRAARPDDSDW